MESLPTRPTTPQRTPSNLSGFSGADLRAGFVQRLDDCLRLDVALSRVRLATLGSLPARLNDCEAVRVVLGAVRAHDLDAEAHALSALPGGRVRIAALADLLISGRTQVRAAPLGGWSPDFSVFHRRSPVRVVSEGRPARQAGQEAVTNDLLRKARPVGPIGLVGSHAFGGEGAGSGPLMAIGVSGDDALRLLQAFEEIWARSHDVTPALSALFRRALRWSEVPRIQPPESVDTINRLG